ncbi:hypothetical protein BGZ63DRAFT_400225 [Mariannaea sp. PMI_226]|nr:hypothetical protein BGZ63DRAFT_400225 [Mariannaea sp. PMI_226]
MRLNTYAIRGLGDFPSGHPIGRRDSNCSGWNCLTEVQKFGIIFSIVVTSVVLILAYMYYLGKITSSHQEIELTRQRSRRRRRRVSNHPVVMVQPYAHQQYQMGPVYQPVLYPSAGYTIPTSPQVPVNMTTDGRVPIQSTQPPVQMIYPLAPYQSQSHFQSVYPPKHPVPRDLSPSLIGLPPRQPTWRQRICRAFRLPIGRASTIPSTSAHGTPPFSRSQTPGDQLEVRQSESQSRNRHSQASYSSQSKGCHSISPVQVVKSCQTQDICQSGRTEIYSHHDVRHDDDNGIQSDMATVRSDDFEMPSQYLASHEEMEEFPHTPQNGSCITNDGRTGSESGLESYIRSVDRCSLPSMSSLRPAWSADSESPTPDANEKFRSTRTSPVDVEIQPCSNDRAV